MTNVLDDPWMAEALRRFSKDYATAIGNREVVLVGNDKALLKFGRNIDMSSGVVSTIWDTGVANETYLPVSVAGNLIDRISSSSTSDTQILRVEGHYATADQVMHFVILNVQLAGRTPSDLASATVIADGFGAFGDYNKLCRNTRLANLSDTDLIGDVYVYQNGQTVTNGVPQDLTLTHGKIRGTDGLNQSNKCATSFGDENFYIMTSARAGVARSAAAFVDFSLEVREPAGVFREKLPAVGSRDSGFGPIFNLPPYVIVPPNSDIRVRGTASANSVTGIGSFNGLIGALR